MDKILIIEDEPGLQLALKDRLTEEGYDVEIEGNGLRGEKIALESRFDLLILDVMLPDRDGFQICRNLRDKGITLPILMLTARNTAIDTVLGLQFGADDYLGKPFDFPVLLARIAALLRRSRQHNSHGSDRIRILFSEYTLDREARILTGREGNVDLSNRLYGLLEFFILRHDQILSRKIILNEVWGYGSDISSRTVDVHVAWLREKLKEQKHPRHLITLRGKGYKFILNPENQGER
jgi:DNA-binding response OmpR family regulator